MINAGRDQISDGPILLFFVAFAAFFSLGVKNGSFLYFSFCLVLYS